MGKLLYNRTLEKIPENPQEKIESHVEEFCKYVKNFSTKQNAELNRLTKQTLIFFFLH